MWQLIAKAVLGGIGGGMKEAGNSSKTNISGNSEGNTDTAKNTEETSSLLGSSMGKIGKSLLSKKGGNQ